MKIAGMKQRGGGQALVTLCCCASGGGGESERDRHRSVRGTPADFHHRFPRSHDLERWMRLGRLLLQRLYPPGAIPARA